MSFFRLICCFGALAGLAACSPLAALNVTVPTSDLSVASDIAYGPAPRMKLDVYAPRGRKRSLPVLVFIYGGSWKDGARADYLFVGEQLAQRGFVVVIPDYRIYPKVRFPTFVEDVARAMRWTVDNAAAHGGDPKQLYLIGHSAGAHIAALLALDNHYLAGQGLSQSDIRGVVGLAGPYAFYPSRTASVAPVFAGLADENTARPIAFADNAAPPMLLLHGADDGTVYPRNTEQLAQAVRNAGGRVRRIIYPDIGHIGILLALSRPFSGFAPVLDDIVSFVSGDVAQTR